jgi:hypothetical protein
MSKGAIPPQGHLVLMTNLINWINRNNRGASQEKKYSGKFSRKIEFLCCFFCFWTINRKKFLKGILMKSNNEISFWICCKFQLWRCNYSKQEAILEGVDGLHKKRDGKIHLSNKIVEMMTDPKVADSIKKKNDKIAR